MAQLPAFLAYTLGSAITAELTLLVGLVLLLNLRRLVAAARRRF
jgi:hypothetical protein